jgi:phosphatidylserine/phosphatidylglycerophosphate/cardiolipin synthase-like enzyme
MKYTTVERIQEVTRFITDLKVVMGEVVDECVKRGVEIDVISDNVNELALITGSVLAKKSKFATRLQADHRPEKR